MIRKKTEKKVGGRPRKFRESSRPITVTLPERILELLAIINPDRAQAIVKATEAVCPSDALPGRRVQVVEVASGTGLIVVGPNRYFSHIPWMRLVEVAPTRYLISIPSGTPVDSLEIALSDLMDDIPESDSQDRAVLHELQKLFRAGRRAQLVSKAEIMFVNTDKLAQLKS